MITKQSFQQVVALLTMLSSLLACNESGKPQAVLLEDYIASSEGQVKEKISQKEEVPENTIDEYAFNQELVIASPEDEAPYNYNLKSPTYNYYRYNQDKIEDDEPMTIIGFPGLTDTQGPTTLIKPLLGKHNIGKSYTIITRTSENEYMETHIQNTYQTLSEEDRLHDRLLLVPESFGTYPAYGITQAHPELNIAGMISIHGPWEGVSGAAHLLKTYQNLQTLHLGWAVDSLLARYQLPNYKIPKALATLDPHGPFVQKIKYSLPTVKYPILALAGNKKQKRTGPYAYLYNLCKESKWRRVCSFGTSLFLGSIDNIIQEYELGNDGLVTTASALAANIPNKPTHFRGVVADATHFHYELTLYPELLKEVNDFLSTLEKGRVEK